MRFRFGRPHPAVLSTTLATVLWLLLTMAAFAQEPTGPSTPPPDEAILPFFLWMIGLGVGILVLCLLIMGFFQWMSGSDIPVVSPLLRRGASTEASSKKS